MAGVFRLANRSCSDSTLEKSPSKTGIGENVEDPHLAFRLPVVNWRECWMKELTTANLIVPSCHVFFSIGHKCSGSRRWRCGEISRKCVNALSMLSTLAASGPRMLQASLEEPRNETVARGLSSMCLTSLASQPSTHLVTQTRSQAAVLTPKLHQCGVALCAEQHPPSCAGGSI